VLQFATAQILEVEMPRFVFDLVMYARGNPNLTRRGETFDPCRDVNAVTINVAAFDNYIAEINADAQLDTAISRRGGANLANLLLQIDRAGDSIDGAGDLNQHAIAHYLDDAALMPLKQGGQDFAPERFQRG